MNFNYRINLQLFSGEKTEAPTPKKRSDAREKGQILQSKEISTAIVLILVFWGLRKFGHHMLNYLMGFTKSTYKNYLFDEGIFTAEGIKILFYKIIITTVIVVIPITIIALVTGLVITYMQVGFLFTTKTLEIKLSKLNPIEGFKRLFSKRSIVELIKSLIKIFIVGYVVYNYALKEIVNIINLPDSDIGSIVAYLGDTVVNLAFKAGTVLVVMAAFDYLYQWWDYEKNLKMSKQEVKEEHKQAEGDPKIKSKIKEKQRQMAMSRMMSEVPNADVIITNPTHYAVAIKYEKDLYQAPYVLAKGQDLIAQNIKKLAGENDVPIVENKILARALYSDVEIGHIIPEELYQSVAEILAYVYNLKN
ncbi:flagellar biosynthetic protein FlhB [Gottschalkia acidurici 9a]|uniref:Flagellar biosynthetic protein FlhB n=1 Tax=Gottschalkia acidurici (strain ATCC 7906 / DSM 604 / BCRC 14475 / CIP 104303 / KCTC 5404 / NCIMB 10678 / 9a) TaxID=1128398 RepID=K0B1M1_GOTA9|nr:flagellar biosynthesis protein FlhB [Gottschalkia acidurici]AFS78591.1 flagellar biosynthetic protein FlhB [Gottschalkia acidurici 9a]